MVRHITIDFISLATNDNKAGCFATDNIDQLYTKVLQFYFI